MRPVGGRRRPPRASIIVDIDREALHALRKLGELITFKEADHFVVQTCSVMLTTVMSGNRNEAFDAFERMIVLHKLANGRKHDAAWGEFVTLLDYFVNLHAHQDTLRNDLEELLVGRTLSEFPEDMFTVTFSKSDSYLMVS